MFDEVSPSDKDFRTGRRQTRGLRRGLVVVALAFCLQAGPAQSEEAYRPSDAGQPLRVIAYVVHPVGVVFDYLILRPAYWIGSYQPFRTLFGRAD